MSISGGRILSEAAYAQGKMLDHSGWKLARKITPMDIDMVVESNGCFLCVELKKGGAHYKTLSIGQRRAFKALLAQSDNNLLVLAGHEVGSDRAIDTLHDISSIYVRHGRWGEYSNQDRTQVFPRWTWLVEGWASNPHRILALLEQYGTHNVLAGSEVLRELQDKKAATRTTLEADGWIGRMKKPMIRLKSKKITGCSWASDAQMNLGI